jgi:hypothetical protein
MSSHFECSECPKRPGNVYAAELHENTTGHDVFEIDGDAPRPAALVQGEKK